MSGKRSRTAPIVLCRLSLCLLLAFGVTACGARDSRNDTQTAAALRTGEEDGLRTGEEDGLRTGEEDGLRTGEEDGLRTGGEDEARTGGTDTSGIVLGDEQFDEYLPLLAGKRVALFSNHTGIVGDRTSATDHGPSAVSTATDHGASGISTATGFAAPNASTATDRAFPDASSALGLVDPDRPFGTDPDGRETVYGEHILDALLSHGVDVTLIFSPEHGFRGTEDAGAAVADSVDEQTGIPILSLYGGDGPLRAARQNTDRFDILVADLQDVGLRYYTYYLTLYSLMDICSTTGRKVLILDRPNPNGFYVDGPILQERYRSGVGRLPIPIVYGMTWGELAGMINGEGWLSAGKDACDLTVIPCRNYTHQMKYALIRCPSPNLKDMRAVYLYASTCFFENTAMSVGRGTEFPFETFGSPELKGIAGCSFAFTPRSMPGALNPPLRDKTCYGEDLRTIPLEEIWENGIDPSYLIRAYQAYGRTTGGGSFWGKPDGTGIYWIDRLSGSDALRTMVEEGKTPEEIKASWQEECRAFREQRKPYLLYEDIAD